MNDFEITVDEYLPLREVVFITLRSAILRGELKPGERLMEITLANKMGVSRTPVREAIRKLELEGLVTMIPRKGAQVAQITEKELNDVLEVRRALELLAAEKACDRIDEEQLGQLDEAAEHFAQLITTEDLTELTQADVHFHDIIYEAADNRRLMQILSNLREQMYRYRIEYLKESKARQSLVKEHSEICCALRAHDSRRACELMCLHIDNQKRAIARGLRE